MKKTMKGKDTIEMLLGLAEGESVLVGGEEWTALGGSFETDYGDGDSRIVQMDALRDELDDDAEYEVVR